jgi:tetratricopeptide (TPR) repeat protein
MAEDWQSAFGRYLRTLRKRCGLSLRDVASLSQSFPDTLNKGYLSRCENGRQRLGLSKLIPLSRIYKVPSDVVLERMELDLELERVGGPDTEGMGYAALTEAGSDAMKQGQRWHAYAYLRDSLANAADDPVREKFVNRDEQIGWAYQNCGSAARALGKLRLALHEFQFVHDSGALGTRFRPILLERLATTLRGLGNNADARRFGDDAIRAVTPAFDQGLLGYLYSSRAVQAHRDAEHDLAAELFSKAYKAFHREDLASGCARTLVNIAQLYFDLGRYRAARRALLASEKTAQPIGDQRILALGHMLMGELDAIDGHSDQATKHWKNASWTAKKLDDKTLRFKAEYLLLKQARDSKNLPVARAILRRLKRLANYVPAKTPELGDFLELMSRDDIAS